MTPFSKLFLAIAAFLLIQCESTTTVIVNETPLIVKDTANAVERNNTLFVFVGEKIDFTRIPFEESGMDIGVKARYKVLQRVYGNYNKSIIEFEAYDHYGVPQFTKYKTGLLFLSENEGKFYQEKYMFDPVFKTNDGRWAGPYSTEYKHSYNWNTTVKPLKIEFVEEVSFPTKSLNADGVMLTYNFPEPYYKIIGDRAFAIYGNYIEELFKLKRDGVLTARDLFDGKKAKEEELERRKDSTSDEDY